MNDFHEQEEYQYPSHDQHNVYPNQQQQQAFEPQSNNVTKDFHRRRMSLDVFKVPFNLNKTRRATCAASDIKRMLTIKTPSALVRHHQKKESRHGSNNVELSGAGGGGHEGGSGGGGNADEILKTSRYHPDEQFMDGHIYERQLQLQQQFQGGQEGYTLDDSQDSYQCQSYAAEESYNPFEQHRYDNHAGNGHDLGVHPFDSVPAQHDTNPYCPQPSFQAPSQPEQQKPANLSRRRYSVFSDWSIEDCPRLLAMQQRLQQEQQHESQEYQDMTASQVLLSRSKTDTSLGQNYDDITQQRRHTTSIATANTHHSMPGSTSPVLEPAATTEKTERPRRNTVILGKNLIRSATAAPTRRRPNPETSSLKSANSLHHHHRTTDAYDASLQRRQQQQQQQQERDHGHGHGQQQWRQPIGRPESSHSYKHDFLKDTARWKPHPWTAASSSYSYSSACSSPSSPLYQSRFPHELVDDDDNDDEEDDDEDDEDSSSDDSDDNTGDAESSDERDRHRASAMAEDRGKVQGGKHRQQESHGRRSSHSYSQNQRNDRHRRHSYVEEQDLWQIRNKQRQSDHSSDAHSYRSLPGTTKTSRRPKPEPLYHDMKAIQMRPYGHEDDDHDDQNVGEEGEDSDRVEDVGFERSQGQANYQTEQEYESGQYYYDESSEWQRQYSQQGHEYYESSMSHSSSAASFSGYGASTTTPAKTRSQDSLAKKASLAKAKFYKYLNHTKSSTSSSSSSTSGQQQQHYRTPHINGSGSSDLDSTGHDYYEGDGAEEDDGTTSSHHFGSGYSFASSLRARVRLTKTKTVIRQVKRRLSEALSEATTKAATTLKHDLHLGKKGSPVADDASAAVVDDRQQVDEYQEAMCQQGEQWQVQSHQTYRQEYGQITSKIQSQGQGRVHGQGYGQGQSQRQKTAQLAM
ncbi:hypothetical protein EC991_004065 [Linnemannia zychae]|nr:hypothetical protein EC991_004065 [Linnemannia zychae]